MDHGLLPPQALDIEQVVLGSLMMDSEAYDKTIEFLKEEVFYLPKHGVVYKAIKELAEKNEPIDIRTVANKLKQVDDLKLVGNVNFIVDLTNGIGSTVNVQHHAAILYEKYIKRELIRLGSEMQKAGFDEEQDAFDAINQFQNMMEKLVKFGSTSLMPATRLSEARESIDKARNSKTGLSGLSTGYDSMDRFTGGLQGGDLIVDAGFPGSFKSALVLAIEHNAAKKGTPVLMFEGEMSGRQVGTREIAMETGIPIEELKTGTVTDIEWEKVEQAIGILERRKVLIDLSSGIKIGRIKSVARKLKREENIGLITIDYLGLCDLEDKKHGGREQAIDNFCRELKVLAKELDVPIILLAQFIKDSGGDKLKIPHTGLLKGSGAIEAHADCVWLNWNPSSVDENFQYDFMDGSGPFSTFGKLGIVHAKNRQGRTGLQWLNINPATHIFSDIK